CSQYAVASAITNRTPLLVRDVTQGGQDVRARARDDYLVAGHEDVVQSFPPVAHDGSATGGRLEKPHAWRPSRRDHSLTRDVEGEPLFRIELRMTGWRHVLHPAHIVRPAEFRRVLRSGNDESARGPATRRLEEQHVQWCLSILAVCAEVAQVPSRRSSQRAVAFRIHRAVQRPGAPRTVNPLQALEHRSTGEGEIEVVRGDHGRSEILMIAPLQLGEGDRGIDVVECGHAARGGGDPLTDLYSLGNVRSDQHQVSLPHAFRMPVPKLLE